jgi:hypothetical protein
MAATLVFGRWQKNSALKVTYILKKKVRVYLIRVVQRSLEE